MILLIDNYDSFTYNLYQYLGEMGQEVVVVRNDKIDYKIINKIKPDRIVISPGPGEPKMAGECVNIVNRFELELPILGICLGYLAVGVAYNSTVIKAPELFHGKTSIISHCGTGIYEGLPERLEVGRYHSLILRKETLPDSIEITAWTDDGIVMGIRHKQFPLEGIQFHPESILTKNGKQLLQNFLKVPPPDKSKINLLT